MAPALGPQPRGLRPPEGVPQGAGRETEGYRGVFAVLIIVYHVFQNLTTYTPDGQALPPYTNPIAHSLIGRLELIDIFFVVSAYVLGLPYLRAAVDRQRPRPARVFLFRRAVRIIPLYYVAVLVVWSYRNPELPGNWQDLLAHLTFTHVLDRELIFYTIGPAWSLSIEITFYVVLLLLGHVWVRLCGRLATRTSRILVVGVGIGALAALSLTWLTVAGFVLDIPYDNWPVYFGPQARMTPFAVGLLVALLQVVRQGRPLVPRRLAPWLRVIGIAAIAWVTWGSQTHEKWAEIYYHDVAGVGWGLILASTVLSGGGQLWQRVFSWPPFLFLGLISYSIYMWHEPVLRILDTAGVTSRDPAYFPLTVLLVVVASIAVAWVSYWVIEYPTSMLRHLRDSSGRPRSYYDEDASESASSR